MQLLLCVKEDANSGDVSIAKGTHQCQMHEMKCESEEESVRSSKPKAKFMHNGVLVEFLAEKVCLQSTRKLVLPWSLCTASHARNELTHTVFSLTLNFCLRTLQCLA